MRWWRIALAACLALLVLTTVSVTAGRTLEVVDPAGRPQPTYAIYRHQGETLNFVHPVSYDAKPRTIIKGDAAGRLRFPWALHAHLPIQTRPQLRAEMIYVPALHNARGQIAPRYGRSLPGEWEMEPDRSRAIAFDFSDQPERWQGTLSNLSFFISPLLTPSERPDDPAEAAALRELVGHFRAEYEGFLARWGDAPRPRPTMPASLAEYERKGWIEMVDRDLSERPTWGMEIRRLYERQVTYFAGVAETLPR
jgi:hypothetical protein